MRIHHIGRRSSGSPAAPRLSPCRWTNACGEACGGEPWIDLHDRAPLNNCHTEALFALVQDLLCLRPVAGLGTTGGQEVERHLWGVRLRRPIGTPSHRRHRVGVQRQLGDDRLASVGSASPSLLQSTPLFPDIIRRWYAATPLAARGPSATSDKSTFSTLQGR